MTADSNADQPSNIIANASAEEGAPYPSHWSMLSTNDRVVWGVSNAQCHSGKRSVFLSTADCGGTGRINGSLIVGDYDGHSAANLYAAEPNTWYSFSFWMQGDLRWINVEVFGFVNGKGDFNSRQLLGTTLNIISPTNAWREYKGAFKTKSDTRRFALALSPREGVPPGIFHVDDVCVYQNADFPYEIEVPRGFDIVHPVFCDPSGQVTGKGDDNFQVSQLVRLQDGRLMNVYPVGNREQISFSQDGGSTWSNPQTIVTNIAIKGAGKPAVVQTRDGVIWVFYYGWVGYELNNPAKSKSDLWVISSRDNGKTWGEHRLIWKGYTGMLTGAIETRAGHIVVPFCYQGPPSGYRYELLHAGCVISTNHGQQWNFAGNIDIDPQADEKSRVHGTGGDTGAREPTVVELNNGRIWMLINTITGHLWESFSHDGGLTWSKPGKTAIGCGGPVYVTRLTSGRLVMVWNDANWDPGQMLWRGWPCGFDHGAIALSEDDGRSWRKPVVYGWGGMRTCHSLLAEYAPGQLILTMPWRNIFLRTTEKQVLSN